MNLLPAPNTSAPHNPRRWQQFASVSIYALVQIGILSRVVPLLPGFPGANAEEAWRMALNEAVARGLVFGKDVLFTHGPYASVITNRYHPATDTMAVLGSTLLGLSLAAGLIVLAGNRRKYAVVLFACIMIFSRIPDAYLFLLPLIFLAVVCRVSVNANIGNQARLGLPVGLTLILLTLSLALLTLVKGTYIGDSVAMIVLACALLLLRRRGRLAASIALLFVVGIVVFWELAGQPLAGLPRFFLTEKSVMAGFSEGGALPGPLSEVVVYLVCILILAALFYLGYVRHFGLEGCFLGCGFAIVMFLGFKAGFVRHDVHAVIAGETLALAAALLAIELPVFHGGIAVVLGLATFLWIGSHYRVGVLTTGSEVASQFTDVARGLRIRLTDRKQLDDIDRAVLGLLREQWPQQPVPATVDVYSGDQWGVLANGMNWSPRPNIQSTTAYTEWLEAADQDHLLGSRAPSTVFLRVEPTDNRLPSLEDGLSWPVLLSDYAVRSFDKHLDLVRLEHLAAPAEATAPDSEQPLLNGSYQIGSEIALPSGHRALWAKIDIRPTLLGQIFSQLYKLPILRINLMFGDGHVSTYRFISGMGQAGFVVSPLVTNTSGFVSLALPDRATVFGDDYPTSLAIWGDSGTRWLWQRTFSVQVFPFNVAAQPAVRDLVPSP